MRFGLILLGIIGICSVVGSVIPQGETVAFYAKKYQQLHGYILLLGLNDMFHGWFFISVSALLCLNLTLCSLVRIRSVVRSAKTEQSRAAALPNEQTLTARGQDLLRSELERRHCRKTEIGGVTLYSKNSFGRYGTFIVHLSILLTVIFGVAALSLPTVTDQSCFPGEALTMADGTRIYVDSFHIEDTEGRLDYASIISITLPNGRNSEKTEIRVNYPLSFGGCKVYQQTYGTAGSITVRNMETGGEDTFTLTEYALLSMDGQNGIWYEALYPGYIRDPDGNFTLITSTSGHYDDPVYQVLVSQDGTFTPVLAFPGDVLEVAGVAYEFNTPVEYPGLRIKQSPMLLNALLIVSFTLMIVGLYLSFFLQPILVKLDADGYATAGGKREGLQLDLAVLLSGETVPSSPEIQKPQNETEETNPC